MAIGRNLYDREINQRDRASPTPCRMIRIKDTAFQRLFSYIVVGVISAGVNLAIFHMIYDVALPSYPSPGRYLLAYAGAAETAAMANFLLNDRYTFQRLPGHARPWLARCLRFHSTAAGGLFVTLVLSLGFHYGLHLTPLLAQALAILLALIFNLTMHHLWTYSPLSSTRRQHLP
jgi:putative flippase GtrA